MDNQLNVLADAVASQSGGEASNDAADSLVTPDQIRASAARRGPPRARRTVEPPPIEEASGDDDDETVADGEPYTPPPKRHPYERFNKRDLIDKLEQLEQLLREAREREDAARAMASEATGPDPDAVKELATALRFGFGLAFNIAAKIRGPHWALDEDRTNLLGDTGANALAPYAPGMGDWLPLAMFATILLGTVGEKIAEDRRISRLPVDPSQ